MKPSSVTLRPVFEGQAVKVRGSLTFPQFADPQAAQQVGARAASSQSKEPTPGSLWFDVHPDIDLLLKLEIQGFKPWQETVRIPEGEDRVIDVSLEPNQTTDASAKLNSQPAESTTKFVSPPIEQDREQKTDTPPSLPDLRLEGAEVSVEAIARLADRHWGNVTLANSELNGEIIERLRHAASIRTLRLFGTGMSGQISRLEHVNGLIGLEVGTPLTGHALEAIGRLTQLERLSLPDELTVNVTGAREIAQLAKLKSLRLYLVNIDDSQRRAGAGRPIGEIEVLDDPEYRDHRGWTGCSERFQRRKSDAAPATDG